MKHLSRKEAEGFYAVHRERPFFNALVDFMISGPVMIQVLEGDGAIAKNRELMGATNPKEADAGTIRADFADSIDANAVHGSDAAETAAVEIAYFFPSTDVYRSEEHTSELQSLMRISYAVLCLKKKNNTQPPNK